MVVCMHVCSQDFVGEYRNVIYILNGGRLAETFSYLQITLDQL